MVTAKVSTTDMYSLAPLQVQEKAVMDTAVIWLPHRECIMKILIGRKYYVRHLNKNIFSELSSTTNEPNFKIVCNCIHELLNVFDSTCTYYIYLPTHARNRFGNDFLKHRKECNFMNKHME